MYFVKFKNMYIYSRYLPVWRIRIRIRIRRIRILLPDPDPDPKLLFRIRIRIRNVFLSVRIIQNAKQTSKSWYHAFHRSKFKFKLLRCRRRRGGAAIAAGSQEENGIWALFVIATKITKKIGPVNRNFDKIRFHPPKALKTIRPSPWN